MANDPIFEDIVPKASTALPTAAQIASGIPIPPVRLLQVLSAQDWESFTEEWLTGCKAKYDYHMIRRYTGPGDLGLDVIAFTSELGFEKPWDSFQCKHYDHPLEPNDVYGEVGKIIYHSFLRTPPFNQTHRTPRNHVFVAPKGVGIKVGRLLRDPSRFKDTVRSKWDSHCVPKIATGLVAPLTGKLLEYFDSFDFSIFGDRTGVELVGEHAETIYHAPRFGGGLPQRADIAPPPIEPTSAESPYLKKLLNAYANHLGLSAFTKDAFTQHPGLRLHYDRQRELFYSAESLRNFARDRTPPRTFDALQEDIYNGVVDTCDSEHADGLQRLRETVSAAAKIDIGGNPLVGVARVSDKQGICHQLANDDRLTWTKDDA